MNTESIVQSVFTRIVSLLERPRGIDLPPERIIVAIDGRCASGKTTLAEALSAETGCAVFHMDDYFLRPEQRTPERLSEPGGNVDRERFREEILVPLRSGASSVTYRPFDCRTFTLSPAVTVDVGGLAVVEGSYSCHRELRAFYDLRVFLTLSPEEQLARLEKRNPERLSAFREKWIPLEERYFSACAVEDCCQLRFDTSAE